MQLPDILITFSLICTFAISNSLAQRRNRAEEEFLRSYFGSGFNFRTNRFINARFINAMEKPKSSQSYSEVGKKGKLLLIHLMEASIHKSHGLKKGKFPPFLKYKKKSRKTLVLFILFN